uniref:DUF4629 domain-containing protein n=1 Tax=Oryctolagus cuniculus TaxID=9986 RepID=A0A5F9CVR6_RABIT
QLSIPMVGTAASLPGSVCDFSRVSAPTVGSAWLLPSAAATSFQPLMGRMETSSRGLQPISKTSCLPQSEEFPKSCRSRNIQILDSDSPSETGDISKIVPLQSSTNLLVLPLDQSQEKTETINLGDIKTKLSKPLDAFQDPAENQDLPLLPLEIPDRGQLLACVDNPVCPQKQPDPTNAILGNNLSLEDQGLLEDGTEASNGFADITTLVEEICLPQIFNTGDIQGTQVQDSSRDIKGLSDVVRKKKRKAAEPINGSSKTKIQPKDPEFLLEGEVVPCSAAACDRDPVNMANKSNIKPQKAASRRSRKTKCDGQAKARRTRENNSTKAQESKQSGSKVKAGDKPSVPKTKRKRNPPELTQESFKKPRSCLGMHMLESVDSTHHTRPPTCTPTLPPPFPSFFLLPLLFPFLCFIKIYFQLIS